MKPRRVLIKLSGEALGSENGSALEKSILLRFAEEIKPALEDGVQLGIVVGGGNFLRGADFQKLGFNRIRGDHMGMMATVINSLAIAETLDSVGISATAQSSIALDGTCEVFSRTAALERFAQGHVLCFGGGTGSPLFTTDSAAALRALEIDADLLIKATKVDGVYDKDPMKFSDAKRYDQLSYDEVIQQDLKVMDTSAISLCRDHNLPIRVFDFTTPGELKKLLKGEAIGTHVGEQHV